MKLIALAAATLCLGVMGSANAQSCASPTTITSGGTVNGNTCGGDQSFTDICGGATLTGPSNVFTWTVTSATPTLAGSLTVTPTGATPVYDTALAVVAGASCSAALGNCTNTADNNANANAESIPLNSTTVPGANSYFLIVSSFSTTVADQCGPYQLVIGTLPVKLESFNVN